MTRNPTMHAEQISMSMTPALIREGMVMSPTDKRIHALRQPDESNAALHIVCERREGFREAVTQ